MVEIKILITDKEYLILKEEVIRKKKEKDPPWDVNVLVQRIVENEAELLTK